MGPVRLDSQVRWPTVLDFCLVPLCAAMTALFSHLLLITLMAIAFNRPRPILSVFLLALCHSLRKGSPRTFMHIYELWSQFSPPSQMLKANAEALF